jgi:hypothetical protein
VWPGSPLLAPLFIAPLMALAIRGKRLSIWWALGVIVGMTLIYVAAMWATIALYTSRMPSPVLASIGDPLTAGPAQVVRVRLLAEQAGVIAGAVGGAVGGSASLLLMAVALRGRLHPGAMLLGTVVLAGIGGLGVSRLTLALSSGVTPTLANLWQAATLNALWQAVLGALVVMLMVTPRAGPQEPLHRDR